MTARTRPVLDAAIAAAIALATGCASSAPVIRPGDRVVFLGDSITHAGGYVARIDAWLRARRPDGIYHPFSEERFAVYRLGIDRLIDKVAEAGARLVLVTPPPFDPLPMRREGKLRPAGAERYAWTAIYERYDDEVLARYARWILEQEERVDAVADVRTPVLEHLAARREEEADFALSGDGIHLDDEGHRVIAAALLRALGLAESTDEIEEPDPEFLALVTERQRVLRDAGLERVGHKRPGMAKGLPLGRAHEKAAEIDLAISRALAAARARNGALR
jgi:hypothetical protein